MPAKFRKKSRSLPNFPICVRTTVRIEDRAANKKALTRRFLQEYSGGGVRYRDVMELGPAAKMIDTLKHHEAAGVTDLRVRFLRTDEMAQLEQLTCDVAPAFSRP